MKMFHRIYGENFGKSLKVFRLFNIWFQNFIIPKRESQKIFYKVTKRQQKPFNANYILETRQGKEKSIFNL